MKDKILLFVIGVLIGAVISTGAFYVYTTTSNSKECTNESSQNSGNQPPEMPSGQSGQNNENGQPPEKPEENNTEKSNN